MERLERVQGVCGPFVVWLVWAEQSGHSAGAVVPCSPEQPVGWKPGRLVQWHTAHCTLHSAYCTLHTAQTVQCIAVQREAPDHGRDRWNNKCHNGWKAVENFWVKKVLSHLLFCGLCEFCPDLIYIDDSVIMKRVQ